MTSREDRTSIGVSRAQLAAINAHRDRLAAETGLSTVTLADAVERAVVYHLAALDEGRGLTAAEAARAMRERVKRFVVEILGAILYHATDVRLKGVGWDDASETAVVVLDGPQVPIVVPLGEVPDRSEATLN